MDGRDVQLFRLKPTKATTKSKVLFSELEPKANKAVAKKEKRKKERKEKDRRKHKKRRRDRKGKTKREG